MLVRWKGHIEIPSKYAVTAVSLNPRHGFSKQGIIGGSLSSTRGQSVNDNALHGTWSNLDKTSHKSTGIIHASGTIIAWQRFN